MIETQAASATSPDPWYGVVSGSELEQGDILLDCPIISVPGDATRRDGALAEVRIDYSDVIVMTQSCDLATREDGNCTATDVTLCGIYFRDQVGEHSAFSKPQAWEATRKGHRIGYHVLDCCELPGHEFDFVLVDLRRVFTLSTAAVREFAIGQKDQVRLLSPYREALSQAYGLVFMRIGYPVPIPEFR